MTEIAKLHPCTIHLSSQTFVLLNVIKILHWLDKGEDSWYINEDNYL